MMAHAAAELQTNLELGLPISDTSSCSAHHDMNSPSSFVYSLPSLDETTEIEEEQKPFNSSMPLLTEETEECITSDITKDIKTDEETAKEAEEETKEEEEVQTKEQEISTEGTIEKEVEEEVSKMTTPDSSFLVDESEGLCTLGGEMCSSLSEPPPDMFDLSAVLSAHQMKAESNGAPMEEDIEDTPTKEASFVTTTPTVDEDSCEIPMQPEIVTSLDGFDDVHKTNNSEDKRCKFD